MSSNVVGNKAACAIVNARERGMLSAIIAARYASTTERSAAATLDGEADAEPTSPLHRPSPIC
jgi:hypothetical protein